jgi:hypothetical protein
VSHLFDRLADGNWHDLPALQADREYLVGLNSIRLFRPICDGDVHRKDLTNGLSRSRLHFDLAFAGMKGEPWSIGDSVLSDSATLKPDPDQKGNQ